MFQSSDDINFDEDFLSDAFEVPNSGTSIESIKRNSDHFDEQPVKKICTKSSPKETRNILSIINAKSTVAPKDGTTSNPPLCKNAPTSFASSHTADKSRRVVQRKFPGPAGILPEQKQVNINIKTLENLESSVNNKTLESDEIVCSQFTEDIFKKAPWQRMFSDWCNPNHQLSLPDKYTIAWTKSQASVKRLIGQKTPFLAAVIQSIDCSSKDPMILLKDKTDEIQATIIHEAWEEYSEILLPGTVIVLKQVGVLSTVKRHYLAITLNNLVTIYSPRDCDNSSNCLVTTVQPITIADLTKTIEDVRQTYKTQKLVQKIQPTSTNNPYFKTPANYVKEFVLGPSSKSNTPAKDSHLLSRNVASSSSPAQKANKFVFKAKTNTSITANELCNVNKQLDNFNGSLPNLDISLDAGNSNENDILTQVLDGVDTDSLFEDF